MILSDVSIKRPVFATMINVVLIVFGLFSYGKLGIDQFPNVDFPVVVVSVPYPGADPRSVEQKILEPLEKALNSIEGLETLSSTAFANVAQVVLQFKLERNSAQAAQDVRDKVNLVQGQFPAEAKSPVVAKFDVGGAPILNLTLSSQSVPYGRLSQLAKDLVKPAIEQVPGVGNVELVGQRAREIQVKVSRSKLESFGLSPLQVSQALQSQLIDIPSGKIESKDELLRIRTEGTLGSAADISKIVIPLRSGQKIRVEDVATVEDTLEDETGYATQNGETAIALSVYKQSGGNTVAVADVARAKVLDFKKTLPEGVTLSIAQDNSTYIKGSIDSVKFDLVLGALLAVVIVLFFLHDWRATIISAMAIPTSVIATFFFVQYMGFTLNMMTTLALTLSIGILVDDAIVVIENIYRRLELGEKPMDAARNGTSEIGLAALAITLSIVAVFIPVAFMDGILGRFFYSFGMTVAFAVLVSLFVAFTLTPMLSSRLLKESMHGHTPRIFKPIARFLDGVDATYKRTLAVALRFRMTTMLAGVGVLIVSVVLLQYVPKAFFPKEDRSQFSVNYQLKEGTPLSVMKIKGLALEKTLRAYPGVESVVMAIGANVERKPNLARYDINLVPVGARSFSQDAMMDRVRKDLAARRGSNAGETFEVNAQTGAGGGRSQPIQLILSGSDFEALRAFANQMKEFVATKVPGAVDVTTSEPPEVQEMKVVTDPVRAADLGLSTAQVGQVLRTLYEGAKVGEIEDRGSRFDVKLKVADFDASSVSDLSGLSIPNQQGIPIALTSVAKITREKSLSKIERRGGLRQIVVLANFTGKDLASVTKQIEDEARSKLPVGLSYSFEGQAKLLKDAVTSMVGALLFAVLLVFMVLCAQFESYVTPFVIMMSVPLAFSGAFAGLLITQKAMSIYAMIGLIMLMGLVTKNAILLIDFTLSRMRDGHSIEESLLQAGPVRLRPILMTTAAMIFGMLPIAVGHGVGGEARAPMAVCVIGGLISSTILTLFVVPCVFKFVKVDLPAAKVYCGRRLTRLLWRSRAI